MHLGIQETNKTTGRLIIASRPSSPTFLNALISPLPAPVIILYLLLVSAFGFSQFIIRQCVTRTKCIIPGGKQAPYFDVCIRIHGVGMEVFEIL